MFLLSLRVDAHESHPIRHYLTLPANQLFYFNIGRKSELMVARSLSAIVYSFLTVAFLLLITYETGEEHADSRNERVRSSWKKMTGQT